MTTYFVWYDELERLEIERKYQNINFKVRLVNQVDVGTGMGGPVESTVPQKSAEIWVHVVIIVLPEDVRTVPCLVLERVRTLRRRRRNERSVLQGRKQSK